MYPDHPDAGTIYILRNTSREDRDIMPYKIGRTSKDMTTRLAAYKTGQTEVPRVYYVFPTKNAKSVETEVRNKLVGHCVDEANKQELYHKRTVQDGGLEYFKKTILEVIRAQDLPEEDELYCSFSYSPIMKQNVLLNCADCKRSFSIHSEYEKHLEVEHRLTYDSIILRENQTVIEELEELRKQNKELKRYKKIITELKELMNCT